jgi:CheY-like chemotaxis protein
MNATTSKTLLIVDDSRVARMMARAIVASLHPSWTVLEAASGEEAISALAAQTPDYITMDYNMPGMHGVDAAREILQRAPHCRIVIFSANIQESIARQAEELGLRFVAKPITENSVKQALAILNGE